jgi:hypothetical protein
MRTMVGWIFLVMAAVALPSASSAWENPGHHTVGRIADLILEQHPATRDKVRLLLAGASLSEAAIWADCAKDAEAFCQRKPSKDELEFVKDNKDHKSFHFTDVPIQQTQYLLGMAGTAHHDIVQIIRYAIRVLRDTAPEPSPVSLDQKRAVWLLAHLIGDIHQPLHVGALYYDRKCETKVDPNEDGAFYPEFGLGKTPLMAETIGGNAMLLSPWNNPLNNLHVFWDRTTVLDAMEAAGISDQSVDKFAQHIVENPPTGWETAGDLDTWSRQWANEMLPLAKEALARVMIGKGLPQELDKPRCQWPTTYDAAYRKWAQEQAHVQLGKAGFRLAALLRNIFEGK